MCLLIYDLLIWYSGETSLELSKRLGMLVYTSLLPVAMFSEQDISYLQNLYGSEELLFWFNDLLCLRFVMQF